VIAHLLSAIDPAALLEAVLDLLLAFTLGYCIVLERRLAAVRKGQEGLARVVGELNMAIAGAGASLRALKTATGEAATALDARLKRARLHIDELSLLSASGERIAQRMESAAALRGNIDGAAAPALRPMAPAQSEPALPSTSIMSRLERSAR
jgi:hypothetical protein